MQAFLKRAFAPMFAAIAACSPAYSQDQPAAVDGHPKAPKAGVVLPVDAPKLLSGKERLGDKWMDEQRIDNCKVPMDKRGTKRRPDSCAHGPNED